ncbi:MAG: toprim domain-containing protein, partial [Deltaproteobacteria bacterium]|nr:toprim domain-containing protein [Deltaproteobacteria bacterium]
EATLVALNGVGQAAEIERLLKYVTPDEILVALDNDDSGREAGRIIKRILDKNRVKAIFPEFDGKDPLRAYLNRASGVEAKRS